MRKLSLAALVGMMVLPFLIAGCGSKADSDVPYGGEVKTAPGGKAPTKPKMPNAPSPND